MPITSEDSEKEKEKEIRLNQIPFFLFIVHICNIEVLYNNMITDENRTCKETHN